MRKSAVLLYIIIRIHPVFSNLHIGTKKPIGKNTRRLPNKFNKNASIETLQLVTKVGVFDVDDQMMNTFGGLLGWISYCIIRFIYHKWKADYKKKEEKGKAEI